MYDLEEYYKKFDQGSLGNNNSDDEIPDGIHLLEITAYKEGVSKSGNPYELYELVVASENNKGAKTSKFTGFSSDNEKRRDWSFEEAAIVCGVNEIRPRPFSGDKTVGCFVWAEFKTKDYKGTPQQSIFFLNQQLPAGIVKEKDAFANA